MRELPRGWCWTTLGDLGATCANAITDGPFGSNLKTSHYTDAGPRVVRLQNLGDGVFADAKAHISEEHFQKLRKHEVEAGDLLLAALGEVLPRACIAPEWLGPAIVKADCIRVRVNNDLSKAECLQFFLNSRPVRKAVASTVHGVGRPRLNLGEFRGIKLPLPPIAEQQRIVAKLDELFSELDAGVAAMRRAQRRLVRYRQALLQAAVSGELTRKWREQNQNFHPEMREIGRPAWLPSAWDWTTLGEASEVTGGLTKNQRRPALSRQVPYLRVANVYADQLRLEEVEAIGVHEGEIQRVLLKQDDLLIVEGNGSRDQIGRVAIWDGSIDPCVHQNHIIKARLSARVLPRFALHWLLSPLGRDAIVEQASSTSGLHTLSISKVSGLPLPIPPMQEQQAIVEEFDRRKSLSDALTATIQASLRRGECLRQSILERAFRGELIPQDPSDEPAEILLSRLRTAYATAPSARAGRPPEDAVAEAQPARRRGRPRKGGAA